jgi:hypothetical protein
MEYLIEFFATIGAACVISVLAVLVCVRFNLWDDQPKHEIEVDREFIKNIQKLIDEEEQIF